MGRCILKFAHVIALCVFSCLVKVGRAQTSNATTDPSEARSLNSIFSKWGISADQTQWNKSGELCSGRAIDSSTTIEDTAYNPFIKCDCSYNNKTTCHITALKVYALDVISEIPQELWTLTYLTNFRKLGQNYLTGSLPPDIGNLTRMQYMSIGINALSGELPKQLGNLTQLIVFYMDSSGISGPIPPTIASLKNLVTVRFQGNSFEGPIPSSFSNLTSLTELRISGLSNGSSSLEVIRNMKSLTILELRNNKMSGSIPPNIGEFRNLTQLDLSFNNISGHILGSIFNLSSLSSLFLGNNKLSGTLPQQKSSSLNNILSRSGDIANCSNFHPRACSNFHPRACSNFHPHEGFSSSGQNYFFLLFALMINDLLT
ncbi:uncharacterized protein [Cicer arietinum]|uniref:uncharacterized protein isoform X5 n=1 Tax=Cicer arietinum TaxID=3827 RepID=UPI003CC533E5